jgi:hypothetical protein
MDIIRLGTGEHAAEGADFIRLDRLPSGAINLSGSLPSQGKSAATGAVTATLGTTPFDSVELAEANGFAWARDWGAKTLMVVTVDAT